MKNKQTAVEWYAEKDALATIDFLEKKISQLELAIKKATILQQAKEMEKQQILQAYTLGHVFHDSNDESAAEFYYKTEYESPNN